MLIGYGNSSFGEANIGTWNTISVLLRYRSPYDKKLYLKLTVNGVKVNQLIADEDFSGPSFINAMFTYLNLDFPQCMAKLGILNSVSSDDYCLSCSSFIGLNFHGSQFWLPR